MIYLISFDLEEIRNSSRISTILQIRTIRVPVETYLYLISFNLEEIRISNRIPTILTIRPIRVPVET